MSSAAERWRAALAAWAIPQEILDAAPASPWGYSPALFARRADEAIATLTPSNRRAGAALPHGGTVLDVGCGAGAASLPLAREAGRLIGVDPSAEMLEAFRTRATASGAAVETIEGTWPDAATRTPVADVVVCHHVVYNVPDLAAFAQALTRHARRRVVLELTAEHPMRRMHSLWLRFHGLERPITPTVDDILAVLGELGLTPKDERWTAPAQSLFAHEADLVAWTRRTLCLPPERDPEIAEALVTLTVRLPDGSVAFAPREVVTLWWDGDAHAATAPELATTGTDVP